MTTTAAPQLRRSKRKLASDVADQVSNAANDDAPAPAKRVRKTIASAPDPSTIQQENRKVDKAIIDDKPAHPQPKTYTLPPFLALPRELRDEIYKQILNSDKSNKLKSGSPNIATRCGLVGVNNQISEEFLDAVLFYAPVITTTVRNHNFAPVVTFLNRLSQAQLTRLSSQGEAQKASGADETKRKRKMKIILSYTAGAKDSRAHLNRWLDRFDHPGKRGKEIEFEYGGDGTYGNGGYKQRPRSRERASARWNEEARKIRKAAPVSDEEYWWQWKRI
ncbi:hypothetical protein TW65_05365 [Stemphylium lycopersici]|uniref:Uncharacterized protein n=1 Tax=Stemphylium lycopersici TaxID=183478 RepID=A0A364MVG6_STELY|nr:hypothetical protein TW65_05365 [Stemphylium lycopersici]RAR04750.1 hypothetical protein DDE83_007686 [Stemphylium lycopersici]